jgi:hypothetical protein
MVRIILDDGVALMDSVDVLDRLLDSDDVMPLSARVAFSVELEINDYDITGATYGQAARALRSGGGDDDAVVAHLVESLGRAAG